MTVAVLKKELKKRGLETEGLKAALVVSLAMARTLKSYHCLIYVIPDAFSSRMDL